MESETVKVKVFCPNARVLSDEEVAGIPADKKKNAEKYASGGLWLEVTCSDDACVFDPKGIVIPMETVLEESEKEKIKPKV